MPVQQRQPKEKEKKPAAANKSRSLADVFDDTQPQGQTEPGKYDSVLVEAVLQAPDDRGQSARFSYEIASEGDNQGNRVTQFYKLLNDDGSRGQGMAFLKRDLAVLQKGDVAGDELEDALKELSEEMPGCSITVKQNGAFTNVYLNGISESDAVDAYKEKRGF